MSESAKYEAYKKKLEGICDENNLLLQYIWTRKPGSQSGFLSISCLSYNKGSNRLTFISLGFYAR